MIRIEVIAYNGRPLSAKLAAVFDELGGNIGRADGNALSLPDPERIISRVHAAIVFRSGSYLIRDVASGIPVTVNGQAVGKGHEVALRTGDEIRIGGYSMCAMLVPDADAGGVASIQHASPPPSAQSGFNPFADLIEPIPVELPRTAPSSPATPAEPIRKAIADPFAAQPAESGPGRIPDDFDVFALPSNAPATPPRLPDDFTAGLGSFTSKQSVDELFELGSPPLPGSMGGGSSLDDLLGPPSGGTSGDPLEALGAIPVARPAPRGAQRDDVAEMHGSFRAPQLQPDPSLQPRADEIRRAPPPETPRDVAPDVRTAPPRTAVPTPLAQFTDRQPEAPPVVIEPPKPLPSASVPSPAAPADAALGDQLLREFLAGAGVPEIDVPGGMTPRLMNMLGQLLRESTQGTLDLLRARALMKRELRAEMTMIASRENNPLKFSPDIHAAMTHLLAPGKPGYMTPLRAMRDATDDLRAHELAFMAGMRAALAGVLARFSPDQLEKRLAESSTMDKLVPMKRQAKRWETFVALYKDLSSEAEDDFHALFGKEFLRAYAAQIASLDEQNKHSKSP